MQHRHRWLVFALVVVSLLVGRSNAVDIVERFPIQGHNTIVGVCFWQGKLFAATKNNILQIYDPASGELLESVDPMIPDLKDAHVHGMTRGAVGTFWVGEKMSAKLYQLRFDDCSVVSIIDAPPGTPTFGLAFSNGVLWIGHHSGGQPTPVWGIDPKTGEVVGYLEFGMIDNHGQVWLGGYLWALDNSQNVIYKVSADGKIGDVFNLPPEFYGSLAFGGTQFWSSNSHAFLTINMPESPPGPVEFSAFRGFYVSGDLNSLLDSDDDKLCYNPGIVLFPTEAPITLDFLGTLPNDSPASLDVTIESSANTVGLELTISFWNFNTNSWDVVGAATQSFNTDTVRTFAGNPADHVEAGTGEVRTRYEVRVVSFIFVFPWLDCVDHVFWTSSG